MSAEASGSVKVVLPKSFEPSPAAGPAVSLNSKGSGRILAFALVRDDAPSAHQAPALYGWTVGRCNAPACAWGRFVSHYVLGENLVARGEKSVLPAGTYTLYLVTDGAPGTMKIGFKGLKKGRIAVTADGPATVDVPVMTPADETVPRENMYWSGSSTELTGPGLMIVTTWVDRGEAPRNPGAAGLCVYRESEPPDDDTAYTPGCPADFNSTDPTVAKHTDVSFKSFSSSMPQAAGGWYSQPAGAHGGSVGMWLQF